MNYSKIIRNSNYSKLLKWEICLGNKQFKLTKFKFTIHSVTFAIITFEIFQKKKEINAQKKDKNVIHQCTILYFCSTQMHFNNK